MPDAIMIVTQITRPAHLRKYLSINYSLTLKKAMKCFITLLLSVTFFGINAQPGTIDKTYGTDATGTLSVSNKLYTGAAAIQADDKQLLGGYDSTLGQDHLFLLTRYNKDGSADVSFGRKGIVTMSVDDIVKNVLGSLGWTSIAVQPDGKIVAARQ